MHTDITWTDGAWDNWRDVQQKHANLRAYFGDSLADEHEAEFLRTFTRLTFAAGPINVQADGHGFYVTTPTIVFGLVWTPDSDETMARRLSRPPVLFTGEADIPADWPRTGRWSAHS